MSQASILSIVAKLGASVKKYYEPLHQYRAVNQASVNLNEVITVDDLGMWYYDGSILNLEQAPTDKACSLKVEGFTENSGTTQNTLNYIRQTVTETRSGVTYVRNIAKIGTPNFANYIGNSSFASPWVRQADGLASLISVYVDPDTGDDSRAGFVSSHPIKTLNAALGRSPEGSSTLIFLRGNSIHKNTSSLGVATHRRKTVSIRRWGGTARPIITFKTYPRSNGKTAVRGFTLGGGIDWSFSQIELRTPVTPVSSHDSAAFALFKPTTGGVSGLYQVLLDDCIISEESTADFPAPVIGAGDAAISLSVKSTVKTPRIRWLRRYSNATAVADIDRLTTNLSTLS